MLSNPWYIPVIIAATAFVVRKVIARTCRGQASELGEPGHALSDPILFSGPEHRWRIERGDAEVERVAPLGFEGERRAARLAKAAFDDG